MNNSVFGKTLENIRNKVDIQLISSDKVAQKLAAKPNYDHCTTFDENSAPFTWRRQSFILISQSILVWANLLDLSKFLMYDFHYNYIKTKYGDKAKLPFTDTDSLAYEISTKYFYKDINPDIEKQFDTSD